MSHTTSTEPLALAKQEWMKIFNGGPYTGLLMLEHLLNAATKTHEQFLTDPKNSIKKATLDHVTGSDLQRLGSTWNTYAGRCTSFAVKGISELNAHSGAGGVPIFNFEIYDLSRHRVARCRNTGIVLDSSSTITGGAFALPEGAWARFPETNASWKFKSSESKFERDGNVEGKIKHSSSPITPAEAMIICLKEVEESAAKSVPTLFRSASSQSQPVFHGIIVWCPKDHALELGASTGDWRDGKKMVIQFPKYIGNPQVLDATMVGTQDELQECLQQLLQFIHDYGGPHGQEQWETVSTVNTALIQAAVNHWGMPKLRHLP
ncbi:hypothetical protein B0T26DRAFT_478797 [Lasiosphaeria miniovina]|uniref:Uncharacterized protein n=1 Tax=Lasiosphaeria miniovina TaxID=1954250 RepID=A0AA40A0C6_9PEZI|nr:uncharacterized protein B0T26DRAFT_478797 [Lasiosphaeria miniovina]KAK0706890.1 hypothetical protein B0T26DRAFT_478797 [Lasiosphaeria miniovina]